MTLPHLNALIVESDGDRATRMCTLLEETPDLAIRCKQVSCLSEATNQLIETSWNFAVVRLRLPDAKGLEALVEARTRQNDLPVIAILEGDEPTAVVDAARSLADECLFLRKSIRRP